MKNVDDLISSAKTVYARYSASRMERETVREWVLGLSEYPEPFATNVHLAMQWFKPLNPPGEAEMVKPADLDRLRAIFDAGDKRFGSKKI